MAERFIADTQYGDLRGTVSFDGQEHPPLMELAELTDMPAGYWPLGFELFRLSPTESGKIPFHIVAAKTDDSTRNLQSILEKAKKTGHIHLYRFDGELKPSQFEFFFKRTDIKAILKGFEDFEIKVSQPGE